MHARWQVTAVVVLLGLAKTSSLDAQPFTLTASMNTPRASHAATLLANGTVLVTGGDIVHNSNPPQTDLETNTAEIYNPATGTWRYTSFPMTAARTGHSATLLLDGRVLIAGGRNAAANSLESAEIFDPVTEQFTPLPPMPHEHQGNHAVRLLDGRVLIISGNHDGPGLYTDTVEFFHPSSGTWTSAAPMPAALTLHEAVRLPDGRVWVGGGFDASFTARDSVYVYNPGTNTWQTMNPMLVRRMDHFVALLADGRVLIAAGSDGFSVNFNSVEIYDPLAAGGNGQSTLVASLVTPRRGFPATSLPNGNVLVTGGTYTFAGSLTSAELYNPGANTWTNVGPMMVRRTNHTATVLPCGGVLVTGGRRYDDATFTNPTIEASAEIWNAAACLPTVSNLVASPNPVGVGVGYTVTATITDLVSSPIASAEFSIDGGAFMPMTAIDGGFNATVENVTAAAVGFAGAGVHTICVRGTNSVAMMSALECIVLAVYDPGAGFVSGGGTVLSPPGADLANLAAVGPVHFGFVSKYLPGASTPSGNLEFQFKAGDLNFKSTSMEWLVVTGEPRAIFRGEGRINGSTLCKFEVDAWDDSLTPGNKDAFGLKIFSCPGGDRYRLPATALSKGSIIIHRN